MVEIRIQMDTDIQFYHFLQQTQTDALVNFAMSVEYRNQKFPVKGSLDEKDCFQLLDWGHVLLL